MSKPKSDFWKEQGDRIIQRNSLSSITPKAPVETESQKRAKEVTEIVEKFLALNRVDITEYLSNPETKMLEMVIGSAIVNAAKDGNFAKLESFLEKMKG